MGKLGLFTNVSVSFSVGHKVGSQFAKLKKAQGTEHVMAPPP